MTLREKIAAKFHGGDRGAACEGCLSVSDEACESVAEFLTSEEAHTIFYDAAQGGGCGYCIEAGLAALARKVMGGKEQTP